MHKNLSKSKLLAFRQCPKRLWLEVHRPDLREDSSATESSFQVGYEVGDIARRLFDAEGSGVVLDPKAEGISAVLARTTELLKSRRPIFEAGFSANGALVLADVLLPVPGPGPRRWRMIEVKSSTSVKDYHRDDAAVQAFVARSAGVRISSIAVAHIDGSWVYPGGDRYDGLLKESDITADAFARGGEVKAWISESQSVVRRRTEPPIRTGEQCQRPYACGFVDHCTSQEEQAEYPVAWLPNVRTNALKAHLAENDARDLRDVPDDLLNDVQRRVKRHTLSGDVYFDAAGAKSDLAGAGWPAYFMDFETISFAVPIWPGTKPYQQLPFQFSVHRLSRNGRLGQDAFLDLSGNDPSRAFAEALVIACGDVGPVFVYNAGFETSCLRSLAQRVPSLSRALLAICARVVDLQPVAAKRYYHPRQQGSWSIKEVLPAVAPDLAYEQLKGVRNGGMAMEAYREAIAPTTPALRRAQIKSQLLDYCKLDTSAMVRMWQHFTGRAQTT
jgi:hypothetical protein